MEEPDLKLIKLDRMLPSSRALILQGFLTPQVLPSGERQDLSLNNLNKALKVSANGNLEIQD